MMKPERIIVNEFISDKNPDLTRSILNKISEGALFVYPTETIYGIGGIAIPSVEEKVYKAKQRQRDSHIILLAGNVSAFSEYKLKFNDKTWKLMNRFWPGKLTIVLSSQVLSTSVAIRVSPHPLIQKICQFIQKPIYSTSANIHGVDYINNPDIIYEQFSQSIDFMLDDGELPTSLPSTVVDVSNEDIIHVVREGAISAEEIFKVLNT